jgi:predicted nucleic acid-binding protein
MELGAELIIVDDRAARNLAHGLGLRSIGVLGLLLAAKRRRLLDQVQPCLDRLRGQRFFFTQKLYHQILELAQETK